MSDNMLALMLCRHAFWLLTVYSAIVRFVQGAYEYVMTTNWFRLSLNAAIQLPSGPSVSVYLFVRTNKREILLNASYGYTCHSIECLTNMESC